MSPSPAEAVDLVADVLAGLVEATPGRNHEPGVDITTAPSVGIEPGFPWAQWRTIGRELTVQWRLRIVVGRWETGPALDVALAVYRHASPKLRVAGYNVDPLEPPQVITLGTVPYLLAAFPITYASKGP